MNDLISKELLKKAINNYFISLIEKGIYEIDVVDCNSEICNEVMDGVQSNSGWIPVSERLPSKEECTDDNGEDARFIVTNKFGRVLECNYYDGFTAKWIIAWQPLPEPYQTKGE